MHPSSIFQTDADVARAIIAQSPLATIAANGPEGPVIAVVPVVWNKDGSKLIGHVARTNAFWKTLHSQSPNVTAVFRAADAYVSASAYPSKAVHGKVVPTWNYIAAEARGGLAFRTSTNDIRESVAKLSDHMEVERETPWAVSDAPETYIEKLAHAIVAFEIEVTALHGVRKLSQNKSETDRAGIVSDLLKQDAKAERLAHEMNLETRA
jgi:transcriptional regulator